jgi:hypothetical protein
MWNEIFSRWEVAGKTEIGMVTKPKLIEPFQIALIVKPQTRFDDDESKL